MQHVQPLTLETATEQLPPYLIGFFEVKPTVIKHNGLSVRLYHNGSELDVLSSDFEKILKILGTIDASLLLHKRQLGEEADFIASLIQGSFSE